MKKTLIPLLVFCSAICLQIQAQNIEFPPPRVSVVNYEKIGKTLQIQIDSIFVNPECQKLLPGKACKVDFDTTHSIVAYILKDAWVQTMSAEDLFLVYLGGYQGRILRLKEDSKTLERTSMKFWKQESYSQPIIDRKSGEIYTSDTITMDPEYVINLVAIGCILVVTTVLFFITMIYISEYHKLSYKWDGYSIGISIVLAAISLIILLFGFVSAACNSTYYETWPLIINLVGSPTLLVFLVLSFIKGKEKPIWILVTTITVILLLYFSTMNWQIAITALALILVSICMLYKVYQKGNLKLA